MRNECTAEQSQQLCEVQVHRTLLARTVNLKPKGKENAHRASIYHSTIHFASRTWRCKTDP